MLEKEQQIGEQICVEQRVVCVGVVALGERLEKALKPVFECFFHESEGEVQKNLGKAELRGEHGVV